MVPIGRRREGKIKFDLGLGIWGVLFVFSSIGGVECQCERLCLALASYTVWEGSNLTFISQLFNTNDQEILKYNARVLSKDAIGVGDRLNVSFSCDCLEGGRLGHLFTYTLKPGDTYEKLGETYYANLTTVADLTRDNPRYSDPTRILDGSPVNVTVNCSCGDEKESDYRFFLTYPLLPRDNLGDLANQFNVSSNILRGHNPNTDFRSGKGLVFIPWK
ncbi:hypothetical protein MKW94_006920, partial [Papaver nudicaule]|nr:hypothetical protein [Papaver nudicaule]